MVGIACSALNEMLLDVLQTELSGEIVNNHLGIHVGFARIDIRTDEICITSITYWCTLECERKCLGLCDNGIIKAYQATSLNGTITRCPAYPAISLE